MSIVFLFGAGASYGSGECIPYPPPLGQALFPDMLSKGGFVGTIEGELRQRFEENFEKGMEMFIDTRNIEIPVLLREMSKYFLPFKPGPNNLYRRLVNNLGQWQNDLGEQVEQRVIFATTNYDLLLEQAILTTGGIVGYPTYGASNDLTKYRLQHPLSTLRQDVRNSYWAKYNVSFPLRSLKFERTPTFETLKLHGSCNFLPDIPPESMRNVTFEGVGVAVEAPVTPLLPVDTVLDWLNRSDSSLAPAIAMYAEGKQVLYGRDYVREQQARFQAAVAEAEKIFLVGIRIWPPDEHIWNHVAASEGWLGYVGREPDEFQTWCENRDRSNYHFLANSFEDALPHIEREIDRVTR